VPPAYYQAVPLYPSWRSLVLATALFLLTLLTSLLAGAHFAAAYAHNQAASFDAFFQTFRLAYRHPAALLNGLPFALTLLVILMAHELGHYFACRHHHIYSSYPFFIPAPTLIGTFGAFILIRSPIRSARALFDVGASGPLVGFIFAMPALAYGVLHARIIPASSLYPDGDGMVFGLPLVLKLMAAVLQPNARAADLLLHPVGRAAWVGLFATALNLLPVGQLDGGHIVRSISARAHRWISLFLPLVLLPLGFYLWRGWLIWAVLIALRFFRMPPIYDPMPLDPNRRFGAFLAFVVFILCFMPSPI